MTRINRSGQTHRSEPVTPQRSGPPSPAAQPRAQGSGDTFTTAQPRGATSLAPPLGQPPATPRIQPAWMGNTMVAITREPSERPHPSESFTFGTWARQRAGTTEFNFEVWAPGTTDRHNPDLWQQLDVQVHYRYAGQSQWKTDYVTNDGRSGNNAHYTLDLRKLDPWSQAGVSMLQPNPSIPVTESRSSDGRVVGHQAKLEFFFTVNGQELKAKSGKSFEGTFENY